MHTHMHARAHAEERLKRGGSFRSTISAHTFASNHSPEFPGEDDAGTEGVEQGEFRHLKKKLNC